LTGVEPLRDYYLSFYLKNGQKASACIAGVASQGLNPCEELGPEFGPWGWQIFYQKIEGMPGSQRVQIIPAPDLQIEVKSASI
jgi:hypothetical protein